MSTYVKRETGYWEHGVFKYCNTPMEGFVCSICHSTFWAKDCGSTFWKYSYCPSCGSKMKEVREKLMKVSLVSDIRAKITPEGQKVITQEITKYKKQFPDMDIEHFYVIDSEGYTHMSLWQFMRLFGKHCYNGAPPPIENNEIFIEAFKDNTQNAE